MSEEPSVIDPQEVKDFLNEKENEQPSDTAVITDEDDIKVLKDIVEGRQEQEEGRIDIPPDAAWDAGKPTATSFLDWAYAYTGLTREIELTETERAEFLRAAIFNKPFALDIALMNTTVRCRALTAYEIEVIYHGVNLAQAEGLIENDAAFYDTMQKFGAVMQIVSVAGKSCHPLVFKTPKNDIKASERLEKDSKLLRKRAMQYVSGMNAPRHMLEKSALRVFAAKMKIALDNMANSDFWNPVDAV